LIIWSWLTFLGHPVYAEASYPVSQLSACSLVLIIGHCCEKIIYDDSDEIRRTILFLLLQYNYYTGWPQKVSHCQIIKKSY